MRRPGLTAQSAKLGDMHVANAGCRQGHRQDISVELRILARARDRPDIGNQLNIRLAEQAHDSSIDRV
jgi:hypothetical protein